MQLGKIIDFFKFANLAFCVLIFIRTQCIMLYIGHSRSNKNETCLNSYHDHDYDVIMTVIFTAILFVVLLYSCLRILCPQNN